MITPTHMLMGAALYRARAATCWAAAAGGLLPDVPSFVLVLSALAQGRSGRVIFDELYFSDRWQAIMAPSHAVPLWAALLALGAAARSGATQAFAVAGLLHQLTDFLLHADDPHRHFWPLSDWRFYSPVSYWDPRHYGNWVAPLEIALVGALGWLLIRRYPSRWPRIGFGLLLFVYLAQYVGGLLWFGGGVPA